MNRKEDQTRTVKGGGGWGLKLKGRGRRNWGLAIIKIEQRHKFEQCDSKIFFLP